MFWLILTADNVFYEFYATFYQPTYW